MLFVCVLQIFIGPADILHILQYVHYLTLITALSFEPSHIVTEL